MTPDRKFLSGMPLPGQADRATPRPTASVVAFRPSDARRFRRDDADRDASRGAILLFTGVRYERMTEVPPPAPLQRRRS